MIGFLMSYINRLSHREKAILVGTVVVVSLGLLDSLMLRPVLDEIDELNKKIETMKETGIAAKAVTSRKTFLEKKTKEYKRYLEYRPEMAQARLLFEELLNELSGDAGVMLSDIKPLHTERKTRIMKYLTRVICEADGMERMLVFFYDIEDSDKLLRIERFEISRKEKRVGGEKIMVVYCDMTVSQSIILSVGGS